MSSVIGYDNLLEQGTLTATSEDAAYPVENVADWLTTDTYKPAATGTHHINLVLSGDDAVDYFAFFGQTLWETGGSLKLQYNDGGWHDATSAISPTDNKAYMTTFNAISATEWRVEVVTGATVPAIAVIAFGSRLTLPYGSYLGYSEPKLARANELVNSVSEGGSFLGRSVISRGFATLLVLQGATDAWARANWLPFLDHAETKPFFFGWNLTAYATETAYCWASGNIPALSHTNYGYAGHSFNVQGQME